MKKYQFLFWAFLVTLFTVSFSACSDDNSVPEPGPAPEAQDYHFDIWIALDKHGGMGRDVQTLVKSIDSLTAGSKAVDFVGDGTEVHSTMSLETIVKGKYYYQVPVSADRFSKYILSDNKIKEIQAQPFGKNTYSTRKYAHAWIDDNTFVIMAADGDAKNILWTKINASDMKILEEGTLAVSVPKGDDNFTTSGILSYRKSDNKLLYFYLGKRGTGKKAETTPFFYTVVINAKTMEVESNKQTTMAHQMVGSAYGELLQKCTIVDEEGNLYLACFTVNADKTENSHLIRIKAGANDFDSSYDGFTSPGKLVSIEYLGNGKVLAYARQDDLGTEIDSYSHYYTIIDLNMKTSSRVKYNSQDLPYSGGRFSQRTAVVDGKAYIGVNPEKSNPCIYIYDIETGNVTKGADIAEGYYFEQIRVLKNEDAE